MVYIDGETCVKSFWKIMLYTMEPLEKGEVYI